MVTHRGVLVIALSLLSWAGAALKANAQEAPTGSRRSPRTPATPAPTPAPPYTSKIKRADKTQFAPGIFGTIRWKQEYGFPSIDGGLTPAKSLNCTAFRVQATVQMGAPGTFGRSESVGFFGTDNEPSLENGYYVCNYSLADKSQDFPHNRVISVSAFLGPYASAQLNQSLTQGRWFGAGQPQPPSGYQRVPIGGRGVTLTDAEPRSTVDFEVVYRPLPTTPR